MPVIRNAHHIQLPETPPFRTRSVTRFGVSVEKVVGDHRGTEQPPRQVPPGEGKTARCPCRPAGRRRGQPRGLRRRRRRERSSRGRSASSGSPGRAVRKPVAQVGGIVAGFNALLQGRRDGRQVAGGRSGRRCAVSSAGVGRLRNLGQSGRLPPRSAGTRSSEDRRCSRGSPRRRLRGDRRLTVETPRGSSSRGSPRPAFEPPLRRRNRRDPHPSRARHRPRSIPSRVEVRAGREDAAVDAAGAGDAGAVEFIRRQKVRVFAAV